MNRIFFYIYIILIFIHIPDVLGMTIKQSDILRSPWVKIYAMIKYSSYASILIMIGVVSLRKPYRKGAVSFLFITFSIIFFAHFFLVKLSSFRNASHLPYIYMILAILASSLNIDSYTNVFNNYEYKIRYIFGFLIIVLLIFVGEGIYDTQRVYLSQLKANKENCIGWKNLVSILDQVPEINVFNGREVAGWRANYGLHFLMGLKRNAFVEDEVAYSSSNVSDKDYIYANNFLEYYSFYDSPYYPAYQRHPGLYVCLDIDDIYSYIYKLEKIGVAERIAILNNDTRNHRILSKGSYYFIIPSQNLSNSHKDIVINDKKHSYEIRFFKHCKDYSVYLCNVNNKQVEVNLSRLIHSLKWQHKGSKDFIIMKKANYSPLARYRQEFYRKSPVASLYSTLSFPFLQSVYFENISSDH
ncbi:MAG: hypothetical protein HOI47_01215 [Candidatus Scalindua sp.]|nr:hypothetical protein [Candidatus Scalindua sp.]